MCWWQCQCLLPVQFLFCVKSIDLVGAEIVRKGLCDALDLSFTQWAVSVKAQNWEVSYVVKLCFFYVPSFYRTLLKMSGRDRVTSEALELSFLKWAVSVKFGNEKPAMWWKFAGEIEQSAMWMGTIREIKGNSRLDRIWNWNIYKYTCQTKSPTWPGKDSCEVYTHFLCLLLLELCMLSLLLCST